MFFSRKVSLIETDFFNHFIDFHSHILFGVDDGVKELSESLEVLAYYESIGVKKVILTPHVNMNFNNRDSIPTNFQKLTHSYKGEIELSLAAEYMIDANFSLELERGLRALKEDQVLIESSYLNRSANFEKHLFDTINMGYTPVIAHPERYLFMEFEEYKKLKDCDYLLQLNLLSLAGSYGDKVRQRALKLLDAGMYDLIGGDLHKLDHFKSGIEKIKLSKSQIDKLLSIVKQAK